MTKSNLIIWDEASFEVGIEDIDNQHRKLVDYVNNLSRAVNNHLEESHLSALFMELYNYIKLHFKTEEIYFCTLNSDDCLLHELQHKHFIEELDRIIALDEFKKNAREVLFSLTDWLVHHIQVEDKKFITQNQHQSLI